MGMGLRMEGRQCSDTKLVFCFSKPKWLPVRWVKKLYGWSAKNYNDSTFGWRDFGVYLCSIRYPAL